MRSIKKHTHSQRAQIAKEIMHQLRDMHGDNLIAVAAQASFARGDDHDYSDLEMVAFVKELPTGGDPPYMAKVYDGMLIELIYTTREKYLAEVREVTDLWYIAASDTLLPLYNEPFIKEIASSTVDDLDRKCLRKAASCFIDVIEDTCKVLGAIDAGNVEGMPVLVGDMYLRVLITLSFLNRRPYTTLARFVTESQAFEVSPPSLSELTELMVAGAYPDLPRLAAVSTDIVSEFEKIFDGLGLQIVSDDYDPRLPMREFLYPYPAKPD